MVSLITKMHGIGIISIFVALATTAPAEAFVLLSGPEEATLDVNPNSPVVTFALSPEHPGFSEVEEFEGGQYVGLSEDELWPIIVQRALDKWNDIRGAYVQLEVNTTEAAAFTSDDRVHSIVTGEQNLSSAALANPYIENGKIVDCDIKVSTKKVAARSLFNTLIHEIGHCLGLGHNHSNYSSIMSYSRDTNISKLGADDIAGAIYLYPDPTVVTEDSQEKVGCAVIAGTSNHGRHGLWLLMPLLLIGFILRLTQKLRRE